VHLVGFVIRIYHDARPKHVEFYSKNKFEKLVHLVGFVIRIYHDARPKHVEFYSNNKFEKLVHLVGFVIRKHKLYFSEANFWKTITVVLIFSV